MAREAEKSASVSPQLDLLSWVPADKLAERHEAERAQRAAQPERRSLRQPVAPARGRRSSGRAAAAALIEAQRP